MPLPTHDQNLLQSALSGNYDEVRKSLIHKANPNAKGESGLTPLHNAVRGKSSKIINMLLKSGADPNTVDECGWTPLHYAAQAGHIEIMRLFLEEKRDPKAELESVPTEVLRAFPPLFAITVNGNTLDSATKPPTDASKSNYILIQSRDLLSPSQMQEASKAGLEFHDYVSKNTYLYGYKGDNIDKFRRMDHIAYVDVYRPELKIVPSLKKAYPDRFCNVDIIFHNDVDLDLKSEYLSAVIAEASHVSEENIRFLPDSARLNVLVQYLVDLASLDDVRRIEEVGEVVPCNDQALQIIDANSLQQTNPAQGHGFKGAEQVVAIADTGVDTTHRTFGNRLLRAYDMGGPSTVDSDGHGTHVSGTAVGSDLANDPIRGVAPEASLVVQCCGEDFVRLPPSLGEFLERPLKEYKARVHSNSWGYGPRRDYDKFAMTVDGIVWMHPDLFICFAAGNGAADMNGSGDVGLEHIGGPAAAKNCMTVGASENYRPEHRTTYGEDFEDNFPGAPINSPVHSRLQAQNPSRVADFSSRGPTKENRCKPDIVAPGTCVLSARSTHIVNPHLHHVHDGPSPLSCYMSGTSMATPLVAGSAAVLRGALKERTGISEPSASLVKALLINSAEVMSLPIPNPISGFGRVHLGNAIAIVCGEARGYFKEHKFSSSVDDVFSVRVSVTPQSVTLKTTLVWSDFPSTLMRNRLLLKVKHANGPKRQTYNCNDYEKINNAQQILWENIPPGHVTIIVRPFNILTPPQSFALVWRLYERGAGPVD